MSAPNMYEHVQLADAVYANFLFLSDVAIEGVPTDGQVRDGLGLAGLSSAQVGYFIQHHKVLHHRPNTSSGFAAVLVASRDTANPGLTLAFRGTEMGAGFPYFPDLFGAGVQGIAGYGAAIDQIVDLYNYWQRLTASAGASVRLARIGSTSDPNATGVFYPTVQTPGATYLRIEFFQSSADGPDSGLGIVTGPVNITAAGHSLGGHLAIAFERLFSMSVTNAYVVNSAGFRDSEAVNRFFRALAEFDTEFHPSKVINLAGTAAPNVIAGELIYDQLGERMVVFTESVLTATLGHGISQMTDSAAVYDLLIRLDPALRAKAPADAGAFLLDIFKAASANAAFTLEAVVNMLGKVFVPAYTPIPAELQDNRPVLHQQIALVRDRLPEEPARIERLGGLAPDVAAGLAKDDIAYRYALRELNPFAIVGADYARSEPELRRHDPATDAGDITDAWLHARAEALATRIAHNTAAVALPLSVSVDDRITGFSLVGVEPARRRLVFGAGAAEVLSGSPSGDSLFGGGGDDALKGDSGADYIEGNDGSDAIEGGAGEDEISGGHGADWISGGPDADRLYGGAGSDEIDGGGGDDLIYGDRNDEPGSALVTGEDTLRGGAGRDSIFGGDGRDTLHGGTENDWLEGGAGFDTYVYEDGDGLDTIADADRQGRISYKGRLLAGGHRTGDRAYEDSGGTRYTVIGPSGSQALMVDGALLVRDYENGDLGIVLEGDDPQRQPPQGDGAVFYANSEVPAGADPLNPPAAFHYGSDGDDRFVADSAAWAFLGRRGDDFALLTGDRSNGMADGGAGDDFIDSSQSHGSGTIVGGSGADYILGGSGSERILGDNFRARASEGAGEPAAFYVDHFAFDLSALAEEDAWANYFANTGVYAPDALTWASFLAGSEGDKGLGDYVQAGGWIFADGLAEVIAYVVGGPDQSFDDYIDAGGGNDLVMGGNGSDELYGGAGSDFLSDDGGVTLSSAFASFESLFSAPGDDYLDGGDGDDRLSGGVGNDTLVGGAGNDDISSHESISAFVQPAAFNYVDAGDGHDRISLTNDTGGFDVVDAGTGNDDISVFIREGSVLIDAGDGDDLIRANIFDGSGVYLGGPGDDSYAVSNGILQDSGGNDTVQVPIMPAELWRTGIAQVWELDLDLPRSTEGVYRRGGDLLIARESLGVDYHLTILDWFADVDRPIENFMGLLHDPSFGQFTASELETWGSVQIGSTAEESFAGGEHADRILAFGGDDAIHAGEGADFLVGGLGDDIIDGGEGDDEYFYALGHGRDRIIDGGGSDKLHLGTGISPSDITARVGASSVVLAIGAGFVEVVTGAGEAWTDPAIEWLVFADGSMLAAAEILNGGVALQGTPADDVLSGSAAANTIVGGAGNDILRGGAGDDVYFFAVGDGVDRVDDAPAEGEANTLVFGDGITADMLRLDLGSLVIHVGSGGDAIHLANVDAANVFAMRDVEHFVFADGTQLSYAELLQRGLDLSGTAEADVIRGSNTVDRFEAGSGDDILIGGVGDDVYRFARGGGRDTIFDVDTTLGNVDTLAFADDVAPGEVSVGRRDENLVFSIDGTSDSVHVYWNPAQSAGIEEVRFGDGTVWDKAMLDELTSNAPPVVGTPMPDREVTESKFFEFRMPDGSFSDPDGDALSLAATQSDGTGLPSWIHFDGGTGAFTGTPGLSDGGEYAIRITATDPDGVQVGAAFALTVRDSRAVGNAIVGTPDADVLNGTNASEFLDGREGGDRLIAGGGDDVLQFFADGRAGGRNRSLDTFDGGDGFDALVGTGGHDVLHLDMGGVSPHLAEVERIAMLDGHDAVDLASARFGYGDATLDGGDGNDFLRAAGGDDLLIGGRGNDTLVGAWGGDTYLHEGNGGHDEIDEQGSAGEVDVLRFGQGITADTVRASRHGDDLVLDLAGPHGSVRVKGWFASPAQRVEIVEFADGTSWNGDDLLELVRGRNDAWPDEMPRRGDRSDETRNRAMDQHDDSRDQQSPGHSDSAEVVPWTRHGPSFHFEAEWREPEDSRKSDDGLARQEIARQWAAVRRYVDTLAFDADEFGEYVPPRNWFALNASAGFGFEASVGAARGPEGLKSLEGLTEGFRRL